MEFKPKYINPFTDYGFKKIFGEEPNKDLLLDFLNELLRKEEGEIVDISYKKAEQLGLGKESRNAIFDIFCQNEKGEFFIVEMQKTKQKFFKDRTLYYSTFPIQTQAIKGSEDWNFELKSVYTIAILDFVFDEDRNQKDKLRYNIKLTDVDTNKVFYDKLTFVYLEMPKFNKTVEELTTNFEKWLYILKNLSRLDSIPDKLQTKIFKKLFKVAEIANLTGKEHQEYEMSLTVYRDIKNSMDTAREEGEIKGRFKGKIEGKIEVAKNLLKNNITTEIIINSTGLSKEEIEKLKQ